MKLNHKNATPCQCPFIASRNTINGGYHLGLPRGCRLSLSIPWIKCH